MEARNDSMQATLTFLIDQVSSIPHEEHTVPPPSGAQYFRITVTSSRLKSGNQQAIRNPHKTMFTTVQTPLIRSAHPSSNWLSLKALNN